MTLKGKWRIVEMALWDLDFLDMMEPAYIFSTTKPGASSPSAASPAKSTAARPRLHLYRPTLADFFNSLLESNPKIVILGLVPRTIHRHAEIIWLRLPQSGWSSMACGMGPRLKAVDG